MYDNKELIIFDLDGTLTKSKSALEQDMANLLIKLIAKKKVAVISGGDYPQFQSQFLSKLPNGFEKLTNLYLLPTSGTRLYLWKGAWFEQYAEQINPNGKKKIIEELKLALRKFKFDFSRKTYGPIIEDRGSQITFSALGQNAPLNEKEVWDHDRKKRKLISTILKERLPEYDVSIGGSTSIDITMKGVNKAYGINKLRELLRIPIEKMLFIGDALFPSGIDYPARSTGIDCIPVLNPQETKKVIESIIKK